MKNKVTEGDALPDGTKAANSEPNESNSMKGFSSGSLKKGYQSTEKSTDDMPPYYDGYIPYL